MADIEPFEVTNLDIYGNPPVEWSRARAQLAKWNGSEVSHFLCTTRPDGWPHVAGVGAAWLDGDLYVVSGEGTRKSKNLAVHPGCVQLPTARSTRLQRRDAMVGIVCAMIEVLDWVAEAEASEIARVVAARFPHVSPEVLLSSVIRYKSLGLWSDTPVLPPEALDRLADAMISAGVMERHPGYAACIDADLVREALDRSRISGA